MTNARLCLLFLFGCCWSCSGSGSSGNPDATGESEHPSLELVTEPPADGTGVDACQPFCGNKECGGNGCGGSCGSCTGAGELCTEGGLCCVPRCSGRDCGDNGCGGNCGLCREAEVCLPAGKCCTPSCEGLECGDDGCGGSCGACAASRQCLDGTCVPDMDADGIPDNVDLFPADADMPGSVSPSFVYANTAAALYRMDTKMYKLEKVGDFKWPAGDDVPGLTDIGIDQFGVLYGVSYDRLYVCNPVTVECAFIGVLPEDFNGMTMVPMGYLDPFNDAMVGISEAGGWYRLSISKDGVSALKLGEYGAPYTSAGDAYSIYGVGTFAAVHKEGQTSDFMVEVNPSNGAVIRELGPIQGYSGIFGLAGWSGRAFAFDKKGSVLLFDTGNASVTELHKTEHSWWGAGVATRIH